MRRAPCCPEPPGRSCASFPVRARSSAPARTSHQCQRSGSCRCSAARFARRRCAGCRDLAFERPAHHPRDQHRRDVTHRARRLSRHRHGAGEGRPIRRRPRRRQPHARAHHVRFGGAEGGPRGAPGAGPRAPVVGLLAIGCGLIVNPKSLASTSRARSSICSRGELIRCRSTGSKRLRPIEFARHSVCCVASARRIVMTQARASPPAGRTLQRVPLHPRLARILIDARGAPEAAAACAMTVDGCNGCNGCDGCDPMRASGRPRAATCRAWRARRGCRAAYRRRRRCAMRSSPATPIGSRSGGPARAIDSFLRPVTARRSPARPPPLMRSSSSRSTSSLLPATASANREFGRPAKSTAAGYSRHEWTSSIDSILRSGRVRAARVERYDAITLSETPVQADPVEASTLLAEAWLAQPHDAATTQLLRRLQICRRRDRPPGNRRGGGRVGPEHHRGRSRGPPSIRNQARAIRLCSSVHRPPEPAEHEARLRRRWIGLRVSEAAGTVRSRAIPDGGHGTSAGDVSLACAQRASSTNHERPSELLGADLS